jgi:hypothetical protein
MTFKELLKPTKPKVIGVIFLIVGGILINLMNLLTRIILSRALNPEEYLAFFSGYKGIIFAGINGLLYLILIYLSVSIVYVMTKEKK